MNEPRPPPELEPAVFVIDGPIERSRIPELCERLRAICDERPGREVVCDVGSLDDPDAVVVDALARLQLTAFRSEGRIRLRAGCTELFEMLDLVGLREVLPEE